MASQKIARVLADEVIFESDSRCCVCRTEGGQIHHIDGDRTNNAKANLAFLCLAHHDRATITGGLTRKLSPGVIRRYRDSWVKQVRDSRVPPIPTVINSDTAGLTTVLINAACVLELRKMELDLSDDDWELVETRLGSIRPLIGSVALTSRNEILRLLSGVANNIRFGAPEKVASLVTDLALETIEIWDFGGIREEDAIPERIGLVQQALYLGFSVAYDGIRYNTNLRIVESGGEVLWRCLRWSLCTGLGQLMDEAEEWFESLRKTAEHMEDRDAAELLLSQHQHALGEEHGGPYYPNALTDKLWARSGLSRAV